MKYTENRKQLFGILVERLTRRKLIKAKLEEEFELDRCKVYEYGDGVVVKVSWKGCVVRVWISVGRFLWFNVYKFSYVRGGKWRTSYSFGVKKLEKIIYNSDVIIVNQNENEEEI